MKMSPKNVSLLIVFLTSVSTLYAQSKDLAIGVMVGDPTGVSVRFSHETDRSLTGGAGLSMGGSEVTFQGNHIWIHRDALYWQGETAFDFYWGAGGRIEFDDDIELGVRAPFGLMKSVLDQKAEIFAEVAPVIQIVPKTKFSPELFVGFRYFF